MIEMESGKIQVIELEKYQTKSINDQHVNGSLTVIWRDWDKIIPTEPKMIYVTNVNPGEIKGPHIHKKRNSYFMCIKGSVVFVVKDSNGKYVEIESSEEKPTLIQIPNNFASAHINTSKNISSILTLADIAWKPNDNEMENIVFEDYDWKKWGN